MKVGVDVKIEMFPLNHTIIYVNETHVKIKHSSRKENIIGCIQVFVARMFSFKTFLGRIDLGSRLKSNIQMKPRLNQI